MEKEELPLCGFFFDIDLFGSDVDIYYKGRPKRNSWIGRIFTLLYAGIYIFFLILKLVKMANKEDVTFYDTNAFNGEPPNIQLNHEIFYSGVALIHPQKLKPYVDPSIYNVKITHIAGVKDGFSFRYVPNVLPIEICDINKFGSNYKELFSKKDLKNLYCIKKFNQQLQGHQTYDIYSYYNIQFFPCVNTTNNNMCASKDNITQLLTKFGVTFSMQDIDLTPQDYKNPIKHRLKEVSLIVESNMYMEVHSFWKVINIETDEDIFGLGTSNNVRKEKYLKYDQAQILYSNGKLDLDNPGVPLVSFTVGLSEQELTETRTYPTLIAVIGDVGGFMEVIFSVFSVLAAILTETLYQKSLVNHLFSFDLDKKLVLVKQNNIKPLKKSTNINIYNPGNYHKNSLINSKYNMIEKESNAKDVNQIAKHIKKVNTQKTIDLANSKSKQNVILFSKKTFGYSSIFDMKVKSSHMSKANGDSQLEDSSRIFKNKNNIFKIKDIDINIDLDKTVKENNNNKDENIITRIELNQFKPKFCYKKKREHFEKILLEEGMKIILKKLDVQNLFKKIYKDDPNIDEKNAESEYIEMSNNCKKELRNVLDGQVRTLII